MDIQQMQAMIRAERDARARQCLEAIEEICNQYHCRIEPEIIISGQRINTRINIVALDAPIESTPNGKVPEAQP